MMSGMSGMSEFLSRQRITVFANSSWDCGLDSKAVVPLSAMSPSRRLHNPYLSLI